MYRLLDASKHKKYSICFKIKGCSKTEAMMPGLQHHIGLDASNHREQQKCCPACAFAQSDRAFLVTIRGGQWLSGRVLDSRLKGLGFKPHGHHCVVVLEQDTFILA